MRLFQVIALAIVSSSSFQLAAEDIQPEPTGDKVTIYLVGQLQFATRTEAVEYHLANKTVCAANGDPYNTCEKTPGTEGENYYSWFYQYTYCYGTSCGYNGGTAQDDLHIQDEYACPSTHPQHNDLNGNGIIDQIDTCSSQQCPDQGTHHDLTSKMDSAFGSLCMNSCRYTNANNWTDAVCFTFPSSQSPDEIYCTMTWISDGEQCTIPPETDPAPPSDSGDPEPIPPTTNNPDGSSPDGGGQAPDFHNPIGGCTPMSGAFMCNVPFENACSQTGNCHSSCAGHNGSEAFCFVDALGFPTAIPSGTTTSTTTTTTTTNPDGSTTTTGTTITGGSSNSESNSSSSSSSSSDGDPDLGCEGEACAQDWHEENDWEQKNFGTAIHGFNERLAQSEIGQVSSSFFNISAGGSCPSYSGNIPGLNTTFSLDAFCTAGAMNIYSILRLAILFGFSYYAFLYAFVRD